MDEENRRFGQIKVMSFVAEPVDPRQSGALLIVIFVRPQLPFQKVVVAEARWRWRRRELFALFGTRRVDVIDGFLRGRAVCKLEIYQNAPIQQNIRRAE
jgi:hypothetical protein